jgi:trimethylamine:corrinoid methyltransferase-like protein
MADQHLIMAPHTTEHWPSELYLPGPVVDRDNREAWLRGGGKDTYGRAIDEVERRLAAYRQPATDPAIDAELRSIILAGLTDQTELPELPPPPDATADVASGPTRRANPRRRRG